MPHAPPSTESVEPVTVDLLAVAADVLADLEAEKARRTASPPAPPAPPPASPQRGLIPVTDGYSPQQHGGGRRVSLAAARELLGEAVRDYLALPNPRHALLVPLPAGFGKTFLMVRLVEELVRAGRRTFYAGPRHDFFDDLMGAAQEPQWWYPWQPRRLASETASETCRWQPQISTWMRRGHEAMPFCRQACGWAYVNDECPYHAQASRRNPIIFGMHEHVWLGNPLLEHCDVLVGDEMPVKDNTILNQWDVPAAFVVPRSMEHDSPALGVLQKLRSLADSGGHVEGRELMGLLGGPGAVLAALGEFRVTPDAIASPWLTHPDEAEEAPYNHLWPLSYLLCQEAEAAQDGAGDYLARVIVHEGTLKLLTRRYLNPAVPDHLIWLDATANTRLYEAALGREVRVVDLPDVERAGRLFQVWGRLNNKRALVAEGEEGAEAAAWSEQALQQVEAIIASRGYPREACAVITFKDAEPLWERAGFRTGHFGANRGTNEFAGAAALFVVGTPQPDMLAIVRAAKMLWPGRHAPFQDGWSQVDMQYPGHPWAYPASGFWGDSDLQAVLWQFREAEIIQSVNRARPLSREVDVWLLSSLPIPELPPDELVSISEIFDVPEGAAVNAHLWGKALATARDKDENEGQVTARDLVEALGCDQKTANRYIDVLIEHLGWHPVKAATSGRGRKPKAASSPR